MSDTCLSDLPPEPNNKMAAEHSPVPEVAAAETPPESPEVSPAYAEAASPVEVNAADLRKVLGGPRRKGKRLKKPATEPTRPSLTPEQRLLILDLWKRSGLAAGDFSTLVGVSRHSLYAWKRRFEEEGPAGLEDKPKGAPRGSKLPEVTKRAIVMLKEANPDWGGRRISDILARGPGYPASEGAVLKVLHEAGYECHEEITRPHPDKPRRFEREKPNQLWQTDLFTFTLKRQNRRIHLVIFMDDYSRFIVGYGLQASPSTTMVIDIFRSAIDSFQAPEEVLTDNGPQYKTWRGKSQFSKTCESLGVKQIIAKPRRPQTLGKVERFWGTLWREFLETAIFVDMDDARRRIGLFFDYYNFQRPHQGIEGLVPADRFFCAAPAVLASMKDRLQKNALTLAQKGIPKQPFYLTGQMGGKPFSLHTEGETMYLVLPDGTRQAVDLVTPHTKAAEVMPDIPAPGESALDDGLSPIIEAANRNGEGVSDE